VELIWRHMVASLQATGGFLATCSLMYIEVVSSPQTRLFIPVREWCVWFTNNRMHLGQDVTCYKIYYRYIKTH